MTSTGKENSEGINQRQMSQLSLPLLHHFSAPDIALLKVISFAACEQ